MFFFKQKTAYEMRISDWSSDVCSSDLGDLFICEAGDTVPADGEIIEVLATIDESAITGESAPVIREAGGDRSGVVGGTQVLSARIKVQVIASPGETFLDKMIAMVEGATRKKIEREPCRASG